MAEKQFLSYKGLQDVAGHVNTRLKTVTTIPASADDGAVRLYVGETGVTYKKGHIYQYNATDLEWVDITSSSEYTAGNGIDITDDEISVETYIFTGTQAQWDALTTEQKKEYDICNITDDGSTDNVYTVGEVNTLLDEKLSYTDNGILGAKNLLPNNGTTNTVNGVTFTVNSNGSVTVNGTATADTQITIYNGEFKAGNYIVSKGNTNEFPVVTVYSIAKAQNLAVVQETEVPVTIDSSDANEILSVVWVSSGTTVTNQTVYPMIRLATDTDSTYQPYAETNYKLTQNKMSYADNGILGAKNLLEVVSNAQTISGVTFTVNADKSITVNGTATANVSYVLKRNTPLTAGNTYIISRGIAGDNDFQFVATAWNSGTYVKNIVEVGAGGYTEKSFTPDYNGYNDVQISIFVRSGTTLSNAIVYPMIRLASDPDDTYQPHAMTNRELTEKVNALPREVFVTTDTRTTITNDANTLPCGFTRMNDLNSNLPTDGTGGAVWYDILTVRQSNNSSKDTWGYGFQLAVQTTTNANMGDMYVRAVNGGATPSWSTWRKLN